MALYLLPFNFSLASKGNFTFNLFPSHIYSGYSFSIYPNNFSMFSFNPFSMCPHKPTLYLSITIHLVKQSQKEWIALIWNSASIMNTHVPSIFNYQRLSAVGLRKNWPLWHPRINQPLCNQSKLKHKKFQKTFSFYEKLYNKKFLNRIKIFNKICKSYLHKNL